MGNWSTLGTPTPQAPGGGATRDSDGINFTFVLNDTGFVDGYAAAKSALEELLDHIATLPGWSVVGTQGFYSNSNYTP
jgi:hypothetical protein